MHFRNLSPETRSLSLTTPPCSHTAHRPAVAPWPCTWCLVGWAGRSVTVYSEMCKHVLAFVRRPQGRDQSGVQSSVGTSAWPSPRGCCLGDHGRTDDVTAHTRRPPQPDQNPPK
eukprot:2923688-Prymnesium_polylepis.2